ncbi:DUF2141 domain-containing protein [Gracilimonas tropica]|uniref:DUF2141 domain-containing protein n=1 Tax=Gracilimonas tropica TaxID=454600 RepID=UPI00036B2B99|nr:DUF2141 domain-containing protein [Gracilimonas tropica]
MKILAWSYIILLLSSVTHAQEIAFPERESDRSNFELTIESIPENKGEVRIAIFNSEEKYKEKEDPVHAVVLKVDGKKLTWSDDSFPFGEYAIAVYHDKNENGELDTNFLGIPKEAYGFSNNARGRFGPASWEAAHFKVDSNQTKMVIEVK